MGYRDGDVGILCWPSLPEYSYLHHGIRLIALLCSPLFHTLPKVLPALVSDFLPSFLLPSILQAILPIITLPLLPPYPYSQPIQSTRDTIKAHLRVQSNHHTPSQLTAVMKQRQTKILEANDLLTRSIDQTLAEDLCQSVIVAPGSVLPIRVQRREASREPVALDMRSRCVDLWCYGNGSDID